MDSMNIRDYAEEIYNTYKDIDKEKLQTIKSFSSATIGRKYNVTIYAQWLTKNETLAAEDNLVFHLVPANRAYISTALKVHQISKTNIENVIDKMLKLYEQKMRIAS